MNNWNWEESHIRSNQAIIHTQFMNNNFFKEIEISTNNTRIYTDSIPLDSFKQNYLKHTNGNIYVDNVDSVSAIYKYFNPNMKMAVLNFASYTNPGGKFLEGSRAQEESLCHESFLYNILERHQDYYNENKKNKNKALYTNRSLYSPNVLFIRNPLYIPCDVITCASPNKGAAQRFCNISNIENYDILSSRLKFILDIAKHEKVDTLILGAFGCGVFKQDPYEVADLFKTHLLRLEYTFANVIFAIPRSERDNNLYIFNKRLLG